MGGPVDHATCKQLLPFCKRAACNSSGSPLRKYVFIKGSSADIQEDRRVLLDGDFIAFPKPQYIGIEHAPADAQSALVAFSFFFVTIINDARPQQGHNVIKRSTCNAQINFP